MHLFGLVKIATSLVDQTQVAVLICHPLLQTKLLVDRQRPMCCSLGLIGLTALAGGITMILGMPNTSPPITTPEVMEKARALAAENILCDVGLFAGASPG